MSNFNTSKSHLYRSTYILTNLKKKKWKRKADTDMQHIALVSKYIIIHRLLNWSWIETLHSFFFYFNFVSVSSCIDACFFFFFLSLFHIFSAYSIATVAACISQIVLSLSLAHAMYLIHFSFNSKDIDRKIDVITDTVAFVMHINTAWDYQGFFLFCPLSEIMMTIKKALDSLCITANRSYSLVSEWALTISHVTL